MNFAPESSRDWMIQGNLKNELKRWLIVANVLTLCGVVFAWLLFSGLSLWKNHELETLVAQEPDTALGGLQGDIKTTAANAFFEIKRKLFVKNIQAANVAVNDVVVKTGVVLPNNLWLQKLEVKDLDMPDKQTFALTGGAMQPEEVNDFMNQLSKTLNRSDLEVTQVDLLPTQNTAAPSNTPPATNTTDALSDTRSIPVSYTWIIQQKGSKPTP